MIETLVLFINKYLLGAIIAFFGGVFNYLHRVQKGEPFSFFRFLINAFLAGWLGYVVGNLYPQDSTLFPVILSLTGFSASPILNYIEMHGKDIAKAILSKVIPNDKKDEK